MCSGRRFDWDNFIRGDTVDWIRDLHWSTVKDLVRMFGSDWVGALSQLGGDA